MKPLSDDLEALLDAERDIDVPAPAQRQRMFARLEPLLLLPAAVGAAASVTADAGASAGASVAASTVAGAALRAKLAIAVVSAVLGGAAGVAGHAYFVARRPAPSLPAAPVSAPPKASSAPVPVETAPRAVPEPSASAAAAPAPSSAPRAEQRPSGSGSLRAERLLIETASAALTRGDNAAAIAALQQHARTFPRGALAEEREVLLVKALAASGNGAAAKRRAKDFKNRFPGSMQQDSVDKSARPE